VTTRRFPHGLVTLLLVAGTMLAAADSESPTTRHLLAGVHAFRDGDYPLALVELKVVEQAPDAPDDLAFYLGPTLYKLDRWDEALVVFVRSRAPADPLADFYLGQTYYQLKLYRKARALFAGLRERGLGPRTGALAGVYVDLVDQLYRAPVAPGVLDAYVDDGARQLQAGNPWLAAEILEEARLVEPFAPAPRTRERVLALLGAAWNASGRAQLVVELLAAPTTPDQSLELARAYLLLGDAPRSRALLEPLARQEGPRAKDAAALLAQLPR
jgi:hypothetical protein